MYLPARSFVFWVALLLTLLLPRSLLAAPLELPPRRYIVLSELLPGQVPELRIAAGRSTVVRFESELDPAGTRVQARSPSPFESFEVSGRVLLLRPSADAWLWPRTKLDVQLGDGTSLPFVLVPVTPEGADLEVDVFLAVSSPGALRVALAELRAEHEHLLSEYSRQRAELQRYREDEFDPDVAIATLLLDDEASRYLLEYVDGDMSNQDVGAKVWRVHLAGRTAYVVDVKNRHRKEDWTLQQAMLLNERTRESRRFIVRSRPSSISPGGGGRVVLVTRTPPPSHRERYLIRLLAPGGPSWHIFSAPLEL